MRISDWSSDVCSSDLADGTRIALHGLAADNVLEVVADFAYSNSGEGLHRFVDPDDGEVYLYSQFEVPDARDRKSVGLGKSVSGRGDLGGRRIIKKKNISNADISD